MDGQPADDVGPGEGEGQRDGAAHREPEDSGTRQPEVVGSRYGIRHERVPRRHVGVEPPAPAVAREVEGVDPERPLPDPDEPVGLQLRRPERPVHDQERRPVLRPRDADRQLAHRRPLALGPDGLDQLDQHARRVLGVEEDDPLAVGAGLGGVGEQTDAQAADARHLGLQVLHLERQVVDARPPFLDEAGDGRVVARGFQQFHLRRRAGRAAVPKEVGEDPLALDALGLVGGRRQQPAEQGHLLGRGRGDADVL